MGHVAQGNQSGTWTPTWSGFSVAPTLNGNAIWTLSGKQCTCKIRATTNGTSNSTSFTVTLPFPANSDSGVESFVIHIVDANTSAFGRMTIGANSNIATLYPSAGGGSTAWTATSGKTCNFTITYIIA